MKKQDILSILITFVVGMFAGGYLYLTGFAPQFLAHNGATDTTYNDFTIAGNVYGGCSRHDACASFQVLSDGSFGYLPSGISTGVTTIEGSLPSTLFSELKREFTEDALVKSSKTVRPDTCPSYIDLEDYRYEVTLDTVVYDLDTCGKSFSVDSKLGVTLDKMWNYFATLE